MLGSTGEIGREIALGAAKLGSTVLLGVRNLIEGTKEAAAITHATNNSNIHVFYLDLSSRSSAALFAANVEELYGYVDIVINNAAIVPKSRKLDADGIEMQFSVNVLGYYDMMRSFHYLLLKSKAVNHHPRIVNVASHFAGWLDLNDINFTTRDYKPHVAYQQSKQVRS